VVGGGLATRVEVGVDFAYRAHPGAGQEQMQGVAVSPQVEHTSLLSSDQVVR
jgi:hypothetical protein